MKNRFYRAAVALAGFAVWCFLVPIFVAGPIILLLGTPDSEARAIGYGIGFATLCASLVVAVIGRTRRKDPTSRV